MTVDLLDRVLVPKPPPFALLHRAEAHPDAIEILLGEIGTPETLAGLPLSPAPGGPRHDVLTLVPYRQIAERGFDATDDGQPLIAMSIGAQAALPAGEVLRRLPADPLRLRDGHFDVDDEEYAEIVRTVVAREIGTGAGSNFVIRRSFVAELPGFTPRTALSAFHRLMRRESGAYWTFVVHTGDRTFVGATPERHVSLAAGTAVMNPISGTYRYPPTGPSLPELMSFLADRKETDELYMVVDEELKMMAGICDGGPRLVGPNLREMARLAHTEYLIEGPSRRDPREILRDTMFAPTVTGSPLENACRVIARHEVQGRGYYGGVIALIGRDAAEESTVDSAILIRTADIDAAGRLAIGVGATLVRHCDPDSEVAETRAKAAGLLAAFEDDRPARFADHPRVRDALRRRNATLAGFWLADPHSRTRPWPCLAGRSALVVDAEDTFTAMLADQLRSLGLEVEVCRFDQPYTVDDHDVVVMGPGPGDPADAEHPRIAHLRSTVRALLARRHPFLAVCLSHQLLCGQLGLRLVRRPVPNQGVQHEIDLFGRPERVGFYNSFAANSEADKLDHGEFGLVEVSRDPRTGEVHALRGARFASMQFHCESVLTQDGVRIIADRLTELLEWPRESAVAATRPGYRTPAPAAASHRRAVP